MRKYSFFILMLHLRKTINNMTFMRIVLFKVFGQRKISTRTNLCLDVDNRHETGQILNYIFEANMTHTCIEWNQNIINMYIKTIKGMSWLLGNVRFQDIRSFHSSFWRVLYSLMLFSVWLLLLSVYVFTLNVKIDDEIVSIWNNTYVYTCIVYIMKGIDQY